MNNNELILDFLGMDPKAKPCEPRCDDEYCAPCAMDECPHKEPLHRHHDGCPACYSEEIKPIDSFTGEYRWLSNFHICKIVYDGLEFTSTEAAYQASKCTDSREVAQFLNVTPKESKKLGYNVKLRPDWESIKLKIMEDVVRIKFTTHEDLKAKLLATGDAELIEGNWWGDKFYGVCKGVGENHLGKILMKIRSELKGVN